MGVGSRAVEGKKRKGTDPGMGISSSGKVCRAQHFRLHEPVVEYHLATADDNDADISWWNGVEAAIKCDEVVLAGNANASRRHIERTARSGLGSQNRRPLLAN